MTEIAGQVVEFTDTDGKVLAAHAVELDLDKMIAELKEEPEALAAGIRHFIETNEQSPLSLVLILNLSMMKWNVFKGTCNPKKHTFKIITPITNFDANPRDPHRPPTQALNFVASLAVVESLPVWIP